MPISFNARRALVACLFVLSASACDTRNAVAPATTIGPSGVPAVAPATGLQSLKFVQDSLVVMPGIRGLFLLQGVKVDGSIAVVSGASLIAETPGVISIDAAGVFTAIAPGRTIVVATKDSRSARASVEVRAPVTDLSALDVKPDLLCVRLGYGFQFTATGLGSYADGERTPLYLVRGPKGATLTFASVSLDDDLSDHGSNTAFSLIGAGAAAVEIHEGGAYQVLAVTDLDGDGVDEIVTRDGVIRWNGSRWTWPAKVPPEGN